jgi:hypothetical protein
MFFHIVHVESPRAAQIFELTLGLSSVKFLDDRIFNFYAEIFETYLKEGKKMFLKYHIK